MHYAKINEKTTACGKQTTGRCKRTDEVALVDCPDCLAVMAANSPNRKNSTNQMSLQTLLGDGVLVAMHVYGANTFNTSHTWEELGLDSSISGKRYKHGRRILAAEADTKLRNWSLLCRRLPADYTVSLDAVDKLMGTNIWRWMPKTSLPLFEEAFSKLINQKDLIVSEIVQNLEQYREEAESYYHIEANAAWTSFFARYGSNAVMIMKSGVSFTSTDKDDYVAWVLNTVLNAFPTDRQIMDSVRASFEVFYPFTEASILEDEAKATKAANELAIEQALLDRAKLAIASTRDPIQQVLEECLSNMLGMMNDAMVSISNGKHVNWRLGKKLEGAHDLWLILGGKQLTNSADVEALLEDLKQHLAGQTKLDNAVAITSLSKIDAIKGVLESELQKIKNELQGASSQVPLNDSVGSVLKGIGVSLGGFSDYPRVRGMLKDLAPGMHREHTLLLQALVERVPDDMVRMKDLIPEAILMAQMAARIRSAFATEEDAANWAARVWWEAVTK